MAECNLCLKSTYERAPAAMGENKRWKCFEICVEFTNPCAMSVLCFGTPIFWPTNLASSDREGHWEKGNSASGGQESNHPCWVNSSLEINCHPGW